MITFILDKTRNLAVCCFNINVKVHCYLGDKINDFMQASHIEFFSPLFEKVIAIVLIK